MSFADQPNKAVAEQLQRSLSCGRIAHAYLFLGPRESGQQAMALTFAKALNCLTNQADACDRCESCRRIDEFIHPDVYWVRPESKSRKISVDQIRELERSLHLRPTSARVKVGVLVDAECMGEEASNAFLKTLEEPPGQTVILLLSSEPQRLLPTILSRCLKVSFGATEEASSGLGSQLVPLLARLLDPQQRGVACVYQVLAEVTAILQQIRTGLRAAIEAEESSESAQDLDPKQREQLEDQREARLEGEYRAKREQVLEVIYAWFGDVLLCSEGADAELLEFPEFTAAAKRAAAALTQGRASANLDAIEGIRESLARNVSEALALEVGLLKIGVP